jgi:hypothetical protein
LSKDISKSFAVMKIFERPCEAILNGTAFKKHVLVFYALSKYFPLKLVHKKLDEEF